MYQQHFGLSRPFSVDGIAQDEAVFRTEATETLVAELAVALNRKDSIAVLYGENGTGKSTIAHMALKDLSTCLAFTALSQNPGSGSDLLEQILTDFGYEVFDKSPVERLQLWRQFICEAAATDTRVCLLVEDAASLNLEVLQTLHKLTAKDAQMSPGCNIILTTSTAPTELLDQTELKAMSQRVRLRRKIKTLTAEQTDQYIEFKCRQAQVNRQDIFGDDVSPIIHECSGGIIRVIDNLLESALASAAANDEPVVRVESITRIADTQFGLRQLDAAEVNHLLDDTEDQASEPDLKALEIPTLTEYVPQEMQTENLLQLRQY